MLKFNLSEDEFKGLSEEIQKEYKSGKDGDKVVYTLDTDGVSNKDVDGLKSNRNKVLGELSAVKDELKKFEGVDLEAIEALTTENADLKIQVGNNGDKEDVIKERIAAAVDIAGTKLNRTIAELTTANTSLTETNSTLTTRHREGMLKSTITDILPETVQVAAIPDIILNAKAELEYSEDMNDGKGGYVHKSTGADASMWLESKLSERAHWLKPSEGSNPPGGGNGPGSDPKAPQSYETMMTEVFDQT